MCETALRFCVLKCTLIFTNLRQTRLFYVSACGVMVQALNNCSNRKSNAEGPVFTFVFIEAGVSGNNGRLDISVTET